MWKSSYILLSTAEKIKGQTGSVFTVHLRKARKVHYYGNNRSDSSWCSMIHMLSVELLWEKHCLDSYICSDVVEFGDECMFDDVHSNLRDDHHEDIMEHYPQMIWGEKDREM